MNDNPITKMLQDDKACFGAFLILVIVALLAIVYFLLS